MQVKKVGVVGAGTIGRGVAQSCAEAGVDVTLVDIEAAQLTSARRDIERDLRLAGLFPGRRRVDRDEVFSRLAFTTTLDEAADADLVVENIPEDWTLKRALYPELDALCRPDTVLAANTSAISITRLAALTARPAQVIGVHFMNPVPMMPMAEVVRGHHTSDRTVELVDGLLATLGKQSVVVNDVPGFVTNRVLMLTINEAVFCVQDQVGSARDVDRIFKGCFNHRMGPLETADLIGLDTILNSINVLHESFGDSKYRPAPLLRRMVDAGLLGRKSGQGFYDYRVATTAGEE